MTKWENKITDLPKDLIEEAVNLGIFTEQEARWLLAIGMNKGCTDLLKEIIESVKKGKVESQALRELKEYLPSRTFSILGVMSPYYLKHHNILHFEKIYTDCMWPKTVEQAVEVLLAVLSEDEKLKIAQMEKEDLIDLHFGLGMGIRNEFGLWAGNKYLLKDVAKQEGLKEENWENIHPDDASTLIIYELWKKLKRSQK